MSALAAPSETADIPRTPPTVQAEPLLTCREVADAYHVHVETVRRWVRKGIISVRLVGPARLVRIPQREADRLSVLIPGANF